MGDHLVGVGKEQMSDQQDRFAEVWTEAVERHISSLSESQFADLVSRTRSESMFAKTQRLWDLT